MRTHATRIPLVGLLAATLMSTNALADDSGTLWYGSLTGLRNMPSDSEAKLESRSIGTLDGNIELSDETGFALAAGFETGGAQQVELEVAFRSFDVDGANDVHWNSNPISFDFNLAGEVDTWSVMINARQLFDAGPVRPYIGGGLGFARHDGTLTLMSPALGVEEVEESGDDTVVAYQFMAGVEFEMAEEAQFFAGYRYMATADLEIERLTASYDTHAVEAGIRIRF